MVFPMVIVLKLLAEWFFYIKLLANSCYGAAVKLKNCYGSCRLIRNPTSSSSPSSKFPSHRHHPHHQPPLYPSVTECSLLPNNSNNRGSQTLVCDIHGSLLTTQSFFPYFMLVAFEGGSIFRALFLLLSCPLLLVLDFELKLRLMIFITFCGLTKKKVESVGRAVLPKFYLENLNRHVYRVLMSTGSKMVFTSVPRVMVEGFLKEYFDVDNVMGTELHQFGQHFTGLLTDSGLLVKHTALKEYFGEKKPDIGIGSPSFHDHLFISLAKEAYVVNKEEGCSKCSNGGSSRSCKLPREEYPKPLVFHDGRLAFLPTPLATLAMFIWLPLGIVLAIFRISIGIFLPYKWSIMLGICSGVRLRVKGSPPSRSSSSSSIISDNDNRKGVLYVCTHRTLLDPVFLSAAIAQPLTAVTYSLSKMSEVLAPIKTVRLTRNRQRDGETMQRLLSEGDLVVCPEGTTCREPYLLRFSSLFAELADEIVPVAMNTHVSMFYGTTASGLKCLDPFFFLMNPRPSYSVQILEKLPRELSCAGGKSSHEVANYIQRQLADALGFECTNLTRRDKYMKLAGNEGVVKVK